MERTIILSGGKCAWGECFGCGWGKLVGPPPQIHRLKKAIDDKFRKIKKVKRLKIFASGSFLDDKQFPRMVRRYVAQKCMQGGIKELVIESRPEFITDENLTDFKGVKLTVAIGLEIADDKILKKYKKGFIAEDYVRAAETLKRNKCGLRTYLMVGLPWVKDRKKSLKKSVGFARNYSDSIVLINVFPHSRAPLYNMWVSGKWEPLDRKEFDKLTKPYKDCEKEFDNFAFIPRFHEQPFIRGATKKELVHPFYNVWQDYFARFYERPEKNDIALFIPCAYRKPYFHSKLHKAIFSAIDKLKIRPRLHLIAISSPGVIPYEFVDHYPFNKYDWPEWEETREIKKLYIKVNQKRIENYLKSQKYKKYYCYFKPTAESYVALERACKKLGIKLVNCLGKQAYEKVKDKKNPLSLPEALKDLKKKLH